MAVDFSVLFLVLEYLLTWIASIWDMLYYNWGWLGASVVGLWILRKIVKLKRKVY